MPLLWYKIKKVTHLTKEKVTHLNFEAGNQAGNFFILGFNIHEANVIQSFRIFIKYI